MAHASTHVTGWTGWVTFAAIMLIVSGIINTFYGLGSLFSQNWFLYVNDQIYVVDSSTGGWTLLVLGLLLFVSGALLMAGNAFGRAMGILVATLNIIVNFAYISIAPAWAIAAILVNALVLYAIGAHGSEMKKLQ